MPRNVSRRTMMATGAAATGLMFGSTTKKADAWALKDVEGKKFLTQFSPDPDVKRNLKPGSSSVRLSCVSYGLSNSGRTSIGDQIARVREMGYTAVEAYHTGIRNITDSQVREIKAACEQHDVLFYNIHVWDNITNPDPTRQKAVHDEYLRAIEMAEQVGIDFVLIHSGSLAAAGAGIAHPQNWSMEGWNTSVKALKQVVADSAGSRISLGIESINTTNVNNPRAHVQIREDVGSDRIKAVVDPCNMIHAGVVFRMTELLNECFDIIPEDAICYFHAKDVSWTGMLPGFSWVVPGQGVMDYEVYLAHLSRLSKTHVLMTEFLNGDAQYRQAREYIEETAANIGVKVYK